MMATVQHVTSGSGLGKFQADGFLFDSVYSQLSHTQILLLVELTSGYGCI